jgi:vancomycin resistance protein YoaR
VGGQTPAQLRKSAALLAMTFSATPVQLRNGTDVLTESAGNMGLAVDQPAAVAAARTGDRGFVLLRPFRWLGSLVRTNDLPLPLTVDRATLAPALATLEGERRVAAVEPRLDATKDAVQLVPGSDGKELTTESVASSLPTSTTSVNRPISVTVRQEVVRPTMTDAQVAALAAQAQKVTEGDITLTAGSSTVKVPGKEFRPAFTLVPKDATHPEPELGLDQAKITKLVQTKVTGGPARDGGGANPTGVRFTVQGGVPVPVAGRDAVACCGPEAPRLIMEGLLKGQTSIEVPAETITAAQGVEWANTLGIKEVVGQFTTQHPAGQPRVMNIHRIADLTRGVVIPPGETFSINKFVGRRTKEDGFVSAPAISDGQYVDDIGGGVSQYATTLFNAAFFGGLDIVAYKPHSIYIGRYPFGREATLAYPGVDLAIRNNTPYGVMVWPTYGASSVTVQLWSTRFATGEQTAQTGGNGTPTGPAAPKKCGRVVTERTRTYVDGRRDKDRFYANYNCNPPKQ